MKLKEHKIEWIDGTLWLHYYTNKNNELEGEYLTYKNGTLWYSCYYKNGRLISREKYLKEKIKKIIK